MAGRNDGTLTKVAQGWPRDTSRRELGQVTPVLLPKTAKVPGAGALHRCLQWEDCSRLVTQNYEEFTTNFNPDMHPS